MSLSPETFTLRVYDPQGPSNYHVATFERVGPGAHHRLGLTSLLISPAVVYQVYPGRPGHCFYDPVPAGERWYCMTKTHEETWQQLAVIDTHDQYAYFTIPAGATELRWIRTGSVEELKNILG